MSKRAPSTTQLLVITAFALACFGILLFLWITFGGPTPFKAKGYQIKVPFNEATQLAEQSDVRISGVDVGKVQSIELAPNGKQALATVNIDDKYGPLPASTRAMLRTKTLLGETYIELTPGSNEGKKLADGGTLPEANIGESVQLDEIFRSFDPKTRAAFQGWMQEAAVAINGQGQNLSYAIGEFEPTFSEYEKLFRVLDSQKLAVAQLFRNGTTTFEALRGREGELADLIRSSNEVFKTTAARDQDIEALFRAFPTFLDESRTTTARLKTFAVDADPLMKQLVPAAKQLSPTLISFARLAPEAKGFFEGLAPVIKLAPTGFPALRKIFRDEFPPLLRSLDPFLRNLNPVLTGLGLYKHEVTSFFGNLAAATTGTLIENKAGEKPHALHVIGPITPETVSAYPERLDTNRNSAYSPPQWAKDLGSGLPSFSTVSCTAGITAELDPESAKSPAFIERTKTFGGKEVSPGKFEEITLTPEERLVFAERLFERIKNYAFGGQLSTANAPMPVCKQQLPVKAIFGNEKSQYQHTFEQHGQ
jgi:phospholipid/cholesterol/gamma-HCH transport system substrate-binding protein